MPTHSGRMAVNTMLRMLRKKNRSASSVTFNTLIGKDTIFDGNIKCEGAIRIDGVVNGNIKSNDDIFIGETANIKGNLYANSVYISGTVEGNIYSKSTIRFFSSGHMYGDVEAFSIITDEGAVFNGKCTTLASDDNQSEAVLS